MTTGSSFLFPRAQQTDTFSLPFHTSSPDYKQLAGLRVLYPHVPILALSATCPPDVLRDLIAILRLPLPTDGGGTACFPSLFHPVEVQSSICHSFSRGTSWHREVYEPALSKESALQGPFEAVGLCPGREGDGKVHTGTPQG
jgi:hypothetical protein